MRKWKSATWAAFATLLISITGCVSLVDEIERADDFLYPRFKYVAEPGFAMTNAERLKASAKSRNLRAEILYEMVVNHEGRIVKIRTVRSWADDDEDGSITHRFSLIVRNYLFEPDSAEDRYRTFFYPLDLEVEMEFYDWPAD